MAAIGIAAGILLFFLKPPKVQHANPRAASAYHSSIEHPEKLAAEVQKHLEERRIMQESGGDPNTIPKLRATFTAAPRIGDDVPPPSLSEAVKSMWKLAVDKRFLVLAP